MENNKHHIDKFLKEQMDKLPVEFNEAHWADAVRRLDGEEKRRKPFFLLFFGLILLIGLGITASKYVGKSDQTEKSFAKTTSLKTDESQFAKEQEDVSVENKLEENASTKEPLSLDKGASNTSTSRFSSNEESAAQTSNNTTPNNSVANASQSDFEQQTRRNNKRMARNSRRSIQETRAIKKTAAAKQRAMNSKTPQVSDKKDRQQDKNSAVAAISSTKQGLGDDEGVVANAAAQNKPADSKEETSVASVVVNTPPKKILPKKKIRIYKSIEEYQALNPRYVAGLENYSFVKDVIPLGKKVSDSIRNVVAGQNQKQIKSAAPKAPKAQKYFEPQASSFYMLAGFGMGKGYEGANGTAAAYGFSPSIGAGYQLSFSDRMSIYLSVYMNYISHLNIKETATNVTYSFDRDSTVISVTRKNLLQLNVPIDFAYRLTPKHTIYGGLGLSLGLNTMSIYEDSKQGTTENQLGYTGGLRFMDVNTTIGYEYNIVPKLSMGIFYQQGFFDMTKNDYFNNSNNDKNSRGGLRLRYKFIR